MAEAGPNPGDDVSVAVGENQSKKGPPLEPSGSRPGSQEGPSSIVVLATYSLDFGIVVAGMQKVNTFSSSLAFPALLTFAMTYTTLLFLMPLALIWLFTPPRVQAHMLL